jgi:hypothetical protein
MDMMELALLLASKRFKTVALALLTWHWTVAIQNPSIFMCGMNWTIRSTCLVLGSTLLLKQNDKNNIAIMLMNDSEEVVNKSDSFIHHQSMIPFIPVPVP